MAPRAQRQASPSSAPWLQCPECQTLYPPGSEHVCADAQAAVEPAKPPAAPVDPPGPVVGHTPAQGGESSPPAVTGEHIFTGEADPFVGAKVGQARDMEQPHP